MSGQRSIMEAVDQLSKVAELDEKDLKKKGPKIEDVKTSFKAVHSYLQGLYKRDKKGLKDEEMQRGLSAIMSIASEAAEKVDKCSGLFRKAHGKDEPLYIKEFEELKEFFDGKIKKRFAKALETEEAWQEEWGSGEENVLDIERVGLKDLETVKRDKNYELFYIRKDDGKPFFNRNLLRHIKLVSDFDELVTDMEGDDPLLKTQSILDMEAHYAAGMILKEAEAELSEFFKDAMKFKELLVVSTLNKAVMSLMLAANDRNLIQNAYGKTCIGYFSDFQNYLRNCFDTNEYQNILAYPDKADRLRKVTLRLIHALCGYYFTRPGYEKEATDFIYSLIKRNFQGKRFSKKTSGTLAFFHTVLDYHELISGLLKRYPNGPLFRTLDAFRERLKGFDPAKQNNFPRRLFQFKNSSVCCEVLHMPCPTIQEHIDSAPLSPEFLGYLRFLAQGKIPEKHLIFNLQDRTSWEEFARCMSLEELQVDAEHAGQVCVITMPKGTDFYRQSDLYLKEENAREFMKALKEQVVSAENTGFYFPPQIAMKEIKAFMTKVIPLIHKECFAAAKTLSRRERLDFIELFYLLLQFKVVDIIKPNSMSFTCKDGLDIGCANVCAFYAMLQLFGSDKDWDQEEKEHFLCMLLSPALLIRERTIDPGCISRMISSLSLLEGALEADRKPFIKALSPLFDAGAFKLRLRR